MHKECWSRAQSECGMVQRAARPGGCAQGRGRRYKCGSRDRRVRVQVQMASKAGQGRAGGPAAHQAPAAGWVESTSGAQPRAQEAAASERQREGRGQRGNGCAMHVQVPGGGGARQGPKRSMFWFGFLCLGSSKTATSGPNAGAAAWQRSYLEQHQNGRQGWEKSLQAVSTNIGSGSRGGSGACGSTHCG